MEVARVTAAVEIVEAMIVEEMLEATIKVDLNNNKNKNLLCILLTSGRDFRK